MKIIFDNSESAAPLPIVEEAPAVIEEDIPEDYEEEKPPLYRGGSGFGN